MGRRDRIRIQCPDCEKGFSVPRSEAGQEVVCTCGIRFTAVDPDAVGRVAGRVVNHVVAFLIWGSVGGGLFLWHVMTHRRWAHAPMWLCWAAVAVVFVITGLIGERTAEYQFAYLFGRRRGRGE